MLAIANTDQNIRHNDILSILYPNIRIRRESKYGDKTSNRHSGITAVLISVKYLSRCWTWSMNDQSLSLIAPILEGSNVTLFLPKTFPFLLIYIFAVSHFCFAVWDFKRMRIWTITQLLFNIALSLFIPVLSCLNHCY